MKKGFFRKFTMLLLAVSLVIPNSLIAFAEKTDDSLVAHYSFDEGLTNGVTDVDATVIGKLIGEEGGQITHVEGKFGQAAKFDGESGVLLEKGLISSNKYSISLWLNPEELTQHTTTFFGAQTEESWISLVPQGPGAGETMLWSGSDQGTGWYDATTELTIEADKWTHIALTVDEGSIDVYVDGTKKFTGTDFPNVFTSADGVFGLGVNYWDVPYKGLIDELLIYNEQVLTEEEIVKYYSDGAIPGMESPEVPEKDSPKEDSPKEETKKDEEASKTESSLSTILLISVIVLAVGSVIFIVMRRKK